MLKQVNNFKVEPIKLAQEDTREVLGKELFPRKYPNILICARKNSGKTNCIGAIIRACTTKDTHIIGFVSTCDKDPNWLAIREWLDKKKYQSDFNHSIFDDSGRNILAQLIDDLQKGDVEDEPEIKTQVLNIGEHKVIRKPKKPKKIIPKYLVIFDDLSNEMRNKHIPAMLRKNRHFQMMTISSSQYANDFHPSHMRNTDYFLLYSGLTDIKLEHYYTQADLNLAFDKFKEMYLKASDKKYSFFLIDTHNVFRKNFNEQFIL